MSAKEALARMRKTAASAKAESAEMVAVGVTAYGIGSMKKNGQLARVPQIFGMPRTVTLAVAAKLIALNTTGKTKQVANGAAMASAAVALYQFGNGETVDGYVSGGGERTIDTEKRIARRLAAEARDRLDAQTIADTIAEQVAAE